MTTGLIMISGILVAGGLVLLVAGVLPSTPRLADAVASLDRPIAVDRTEGEASSTHPDRTHRDRATDRLGRWLHQHTPVPLTSRQLRALAMQDRSVVEFFADKAVWTLLGMTMPPLLAVAAAMIGSGISIGLPMLAGLLGGGLGYFVPDLLLRGQAKARKGDASAALLMYVDLVTLERLANASATQALHNAAQLSDTPLFRHLRAALERSRLEQQSPYAGLRRLADELDLPELADLADVMQLDESGAALSGSLRARARELRDASLASTLREAHASLEGMTIYMTIPSLLFAVMFLVPALMRIVSS